MKTGVALLLSFGVFIGISAPSFDTPRSFSLFELGKIREHTLLQKNKILH